MYSNTQEIYESINSLISSVFGISIEKFDPKTVKRWSSGIEKILENAIPEKKKRNRSSYAIFCADKREAVKEKFSLTNSRDVIKKLGELWAQIKEERPEIFKQYEDMAKEEKEQTTQENRGRKSSRTRSKSPREKSPRRVSAYLLFASDARKQYADELDGMKFGEVSTFISSKWKELKEQDANAYENYKNMASGDGEQKPSQEQAVENSCEEQWVVENIKKDIKPSGDKKAPRKPSSSKKPSSSGNNKKNFAEDDGIPVRGLTIKKNDILPPKKPTHSPAQSDDDTEPPRRLLKQPTGKQTENREVFQKLLSKIQKEKR